MKIDAITRERIVMILDMFGWEQDGKGPTFVNVEDGERITFKNWQEAMDFSCSSAKAV